MKDKTKQYQTAIDFIKDNSVTTDLLIDLYLLYKKADLCKSNSEENRFPIPYYLIDAFAKYECNERTPHNISEQLKDSKNIETIIETQPQTTTYISLFISTIAVIIPVLAVMNIGLSTGKKSTGFHKKTDWFYGTTEYERKMDDRADQNQYKY